MADHDDPERFIDLGKITLGAFEFIRELLADLPLPIEIPDFATELDEDARTQALMALSRARTLIMDEPISNAAKVSYETVVLDWFTAYEMLALTKVAGPAPWRLDCAEAALHRLSIMGEMIENGDLGDDES